ncbi:hypothetical protein ACFVW8_38625, partial [Streptomyces sp. NPDC058221]
MDPSDTSEKREPEAPVDMPTAEPVTGKPARTFARWAHDHAHDFRRRARAGEGRAAGRRLLPPAAGRRLSLPEPLRLLLRMLRGTQAEGPVDGAGGRWQPCALW